MKKSLKVIIYIVLSVSFCNAIAAECSFYAAVSSVMPNLDPYYAQLINMKNQQVLVTVGPMGVGQIQYKKFTCPESTVIAKYINANNANYFYQSANSVFLSSKLEAYTSLNNTFTYLVKTRYCADCNSNVS